VSSMSRISLLASAVAACVFCGAAEPPAKPTPEQIAQWIKQLGDDDFSKREEASQKLYEAGQPAEDALEEAAGGEDAEVVQRARLILDKFRWGLYPNTPPQIVDLVARYRSADVNGKEKVVDELLKAGPSGYRTLCKIAGAEDDPSVRGNIYQHLQAELQHVAPQMILEENYDALEPLLDVVFANDPERGGQDYAAYWLMRGKLDERIAHYKALPAKGPNAEKNGALLALLYRAKGDLAAAAQAADKAGKPELADAMLFEARDWKTLARRSIHSPRNLPYEMSGINATYCRLAGDAKGFDDAIADLRKSVNDNPGDDFQRYYLAKVLFLNDRPADGIDVVVDAPNYQLAAFDMLVAQMRYKEALELADRAKAAGPLGPIDNRAGLEILKARVLYSLGERKEAKDVFAKYAGQFPLPGANNVSWPEELVEAEIRVGLKDQAAEHAAAILGMSNDEGVRNRLLANLFPKHAEAAEALWPMLRERGTDAAVNIKDLRALLDGTADAKVLSKVTERLAVWPPMGGEPALDAKEPIAVAEAALLCKNEKLARSLLEKAGNFGSSGALIRLGDLDADKKEWDKAAEHYSQAWEKDHTRVLALYLNGWALTQAGKQAEGKKRMEAAHWGPLGDDRARIVFLQGLEDHGQREAARRERELLLRLSPTWSLSNSRALRETALDALDRKDYPTAALDQESSMLCCLFGQVDFVQPTAYLGVPAFIHRLRAQAATAADKFDVAQKEVALALAALPGDTITPIELIPAWDKAGRKKEAQELFDRCIAVQEKLCKDYPNCAWAHNSVGWVSACCRRNLDSALEHAQKAVELAPDSPGDLDTLAEVWFQRGDKDKAVAAEKKVIEMDPKREYYRRQLQRIEAGDPAAERPAETDDD